MVLLSWSRTSVPAGTVTCFVTGVPEVSCAAVLGAAAGLADPAAGLAFEVDVCAAATRLVASVRRIKLRMSDLRQLWSGISYQSAGTLRLFHLQNDLGSGSCRIF